MEVQTRQRVVDGFRKLIGIEAPELWDRCLNRPQGETRTSESSPALGLVAMMRNVAYNVTSQLGDGIMACETFDQWVSEGKNNLSVLVARLAMEGRDDQVQLARFIFDCVQYHSRELERHGIALDEGAFFAAGLVFHAATGDELFNEALNYVDWDWAKMLERSKLLEQAGGKYPWEVVPG